MATIDQNGEEPVLALKVTRIIWFLIAAILFMGWELIQFEGHVERIVTERIQEVKDVVDHEMDDVSDNYNESLDLIIQGKCSDALKVFKASHICERR
mgnify:CR=1 FL=1